MIEDMHTPPQASAMVRKDAAWYEDISRAVAVPIPCELVAWPATETSSDRGYSFSSKASTRRYSLDAYTCNMKYLGRRPRLCKQLSGCVASAEFDGRSGESF